MKILKMQYTIHYEYFNQTHEKRMQIRDKASFLQLIGFLSLYKSLFNLKWPCEKALFDF